MVVDVGLDPQQTLLHKLPKKKLVFFIFTILQNDRIYPFNFMWSCQAPIGGSHLGRGH